MKKFGIRMDGCEQEVENLIKSYCASKKAVTYYEIGVANGTTFRAVYDILSETGVHYFQLFGLDLPNGWCLNDKDGIKTRFNEEMIDIVINSPSCDAKKKAHLFLRDNPRQFTQEFFPSSYIDICLIDGSHGKKSVTDDFLSIEKKIAPGGFVMFHDFCILSQGTDWQEYDKDYINVRAACRELGLIDNKREGWLFKKEILGTRFTGGEGNGIGVFEKL